MILTHREELFNQAHKTFGAFGLNPTLINAKQKDVETDQLLYVAMVETISRRPKLIEQVQPKLIVIDECHIGNFTKVIDQYPDVYVLGVTATPVGKHFYTHYSNIVQTIDTPDLVKEGFLVPCKAYQMIKQVNLEKRSGEFTEESQMKFYGDKVMYDGVIREYNDKAKGKKTLIFNCNIQHSEQMSEQFNKAGIPSMSLTSKNTPEERKAILKWFENTPDAVLNNAGILTAGYDHPPIECIIVNRATMSLPLWLQMVGRGSRTYQGKSEFILLDFGANHSRHGLWNMYRTWTIEQPKPPKEQAAPVKDCPRCSAMLHMAAKVCSLCDYVYPDKGKELEKGVMTLVEAGDVIGKFLGDLSVQEMVLISKSKRKYNVSTQQLWRVLRSRGMDQINEYGKLMRYNQGWYFRQRESMHDTKFTNIRIKYRTK